ncbi:MAG: succinylglutamate desuccinylase/aspartoacylase family protein [Pseudobdellovibrio sp.]
MIKSELEKFKNLQEHFKNDYPDLYQEIDEHGFILSKDSDQIDLLITGLTHGDEVIGLEIINLILNYIMLHKKLHFRVGFLLNNLEAYHQNQRYIESDLNRSFFVDQIQTLEHKRAKNIQDIISKLKVKLIIDLHQTSEPTTNSFAVIPEIPELIRFADQIAPNKPIVCFDLNGFSREGKTLMEFTQNMGVNSLVYEIGQKGFNEVLANEYKTYLLRLLNEGVFEPEKSTKKLSYLLINQIIPNQNGYALMPDLKSLDQVAKNQVLAQNSHTNSEYLSPIDGYIIFPRYKNIRDAETNIGFLATQKGLN